MSTPATDRLVAELALFTRKHGLVYWQDRHRVYEDVAARLATQADPPFPLLRYDGSFLDLMLRLEHVADGLQAERTVVYLPGFTDGDLDDTPLLETATVGRRFRKALPTLAREAGHGLLPDEQLTALAEQPDLTLAAMDHALGLATSETEPWLRAQTPEHLLDLLLRPSTAWPSALTALVEHDDAPRPLNALRRWAEAHLGVDDRWVEATGILAGIDTAKATRRADAIRFLLGSHALCAEYVDDLKDHAPHSAVLTPLAGLSTPLRKANRALAEHLRRDADPTRYRRLATQTEQLIPTEKDHVVAADLGRVDTFAFEEELILGAAIEALREEAWDTVLAWSDARHTDGCYWTSGPHPDDQARRNAWALLHAAAALGRAIQAAGPRLSTHVGPLLALREGVGRYTECGAAVDRAHRHLVEAIAARLDTRLPRFESLRDALAGVQEPYRVWADQWSRDWCALLRTCGPMPEPALQQRTVFDDLVAPAVTRDKRAVALFVIDALRFEMGADLAARLSGEADTDLHLTARLAELPTITAVGMNVLAPVAHNGKLTPVLGPGPGSRAIKGFKTGTYTVVDPKTRARAMTDRLGTKVAWLALQDACTSPLDTLRRTASRHGLVVVHGLEIDEAGEKGLGPHVFDAAIQSVADAWRRLREAGVKTFVITSDHGFLLLDPGATRTLTHGRTVDVSRRHLLTDQAEDHVHELRVGTDALGWTTTPPLHLISPEVPWLFDDAKRGRSFAHGGPSLPERVIPVLRIEHKRPAGSSEQPYALHAEARPGVAGMHCLAFEVRSVVTMALGFAKAKQVRVTLSAEDEDGVLVRIADVRGGTRAGTAAVSAAPDTWVEVFFHLEAPEADRRVRITLAHPGTLAVKPATVPERFLAAGIPQVASPEPQVSPEPQASEPPPPTVQAAPPTPNTPEWLATIDAVWHAPLQSIADVGVLDEETLVAMLGSARKARRFALQIDTIAARAPFEIAVRTLGGSKRYVRLGSAKETL